MPNFWGCRCCGDKCPLDDCDTSAAEMSDEEIEFVEMICSDGTAPTVGIDSVQDEGVGMPAPSRKVTFAISGSPSDEAYAYALHIRKDYQYDLSESAIRTVTHCVNHKRQTLDVEELDPGKFVVLPLIRQNGHYYVYADAENNDIGVSWQTWTDSVVRGLWHRLVESQLNPDDTLEPNFTIVGDDLEFGYAVRYHVETADSDVDLTAWVDRLCVTFQETTDPCLCAETGAEFAVDIPFISGPEALCPLLEGTYIMSWRGTQSIVGGVSVGCPYSSPRVNVSDTQYIRIQMGLFHAGASAGYGTLSITYGTIGDPEISEVLFLRYISSSPNVFQCIGETVFDLSVTPFNCFGARPSTLTVYRV